MTRRFFWNVRDRMKFRTVFENDDSVLGVSEKGEHKLFRKDTGGIMFDEPVASSREKVVKRSSHKSIHRVVRLAPRLFPQSV